MSAESAINTLVSTMEQFVRTMEEQNDSMEALFSEKRFLGMFGETEGSLVRKRKIREKELQQSEQAAKTAVHLSNALDDLATAMARGNVEAMQDASHSAGQALEYLHRNALTMDRAQQAELKSLQAVYAATGDLSTEMDRLRNLTNQVGRQEVARFEEQARLNKILKTTRESFDQAQRAAVEWAKSVFSVTAGIRRMASGYDKMIGDLRYSLTQQVPMVDRLGSAFSGVSVDMAKYGITTKKLLEVQNTYSQALIAATQGVGARATTEELMSSFKGLAARAQLVTGSYEDALALVGEGVDLLSYSGVKMSMKEMTDVMDGPNGLINSFATLSYLTNKTVDELAKMNKGILADHDMRILNQSLSEEERKGFANRLAQQQLYLVSRGMEIDQAVEATAALAKMTKTVTPKDRYKQAAKIRAISGAMGVEGGEEMMRLSMKANRTNEENATLQDFMTRLESSMGQMYGGGFASQMIAGQFQDVMSGPLYDTLSKLSTVGQQGREIAKEQLDVANKQYDLLSKSGLVLNKFDTQVGQPLEAILSEGATQLLLGAGQVFGATLLGLTTSIVNLAIAIKMLKLGKAAGGLGGAGAAAGGAGAAGALGKFGKLGKVASIAGKVGGGAVSGLMVGKDVYDLAQGETNYENKAAVAGSVIGGLAGILGGPAGVAFGASIGNIIGEQAGQWADERWPTVKDAGVKQEDLTKALEANSTQTAAQMQQQQQAMAELVEALSTGAKLTEEQNKLMQDSLSVANNSTLATKQNTLATNAATEETKKTTEKAKRVIWTRDPYLSN